MSDSILRFISADPKFQPTSEQAERATALLGEIVGMPGSVSIQFEDGVTFYDPGGNWSGVECICGEEAEGWFFDAMDAAAEKCFQDLEVTAPCCGAHLSLNDLRFGWPAGFGRFALEVLNPGFNDTSLEQDRELAESLGTAVRKIWVHI